MGKSSEYYFKGGYADNSPISYTDMYMNRVRRNVIGTQMNSIKDLVTRCGMYTAKYGSNQILNHFGKRYVFNLDTAYVESKNKNKKKTTSNKLFRFLKKFLPEIFDESVMSKYFEFVTNSNENNVNEYTLTNIPQVIKVKAIDKATFIYLNTLRIDRYMNSTKRNGEIYVFGKKAKKYIKILDKIFMETMVISDGSASSVYTINSGHGNDWDIVFSMTKNKTFDKLFFSHNEIDLVRSHIENFEKTMEIYKQRMIPYKTGILLYGKPGTGKTSIINAICTEYDRKMVNINVNNLQEIDLVELSTILDNDEDEDYVVVFEDIDTLFLNREESKDTNKDYFDIIQKLLQFLDGVSSPNNVIFVATTNYKDRLDDAIIREGRFDLKIEIRGLLEKEAIGMIHSFAFNEHDAKEILASIAPDEDGLYNQAKLQAEVLRHLGIKNFKEEDSNKYLTSATKEEKDTDETSDFEDYED